VHLLPRAIGSVLAQSFTDFELIVADDCSQQDIRSLVESYRDPRLLYVRRERNGGAPAARNSAIARARGEFLAFQDSDDEWICDKLQLQVDAIRSEPPSTAMVFCGMLRNAGGQVSYYPAPHLVPGPESYHATVQMNAIAFTQTWLVRRDVFLETGPFDESLKIWDDWDMLMRLTSRHEVRYLPQALALSHVSPDSVTRDLPARARDLRRIINKYEPKASRNDKFLGQLYYLLGRFQYLNGEMAEARSSLRRALSYNHAGLKPAALLLLSVLGERAARRFLK
jgi:glycosyltransferase involved in cell wall biosynthesis